MDDAIEKSTMRKVYMRLLPFAILSYFLAYIDRINVSFAATERSRASGCPRMGIRGATRRSDA